MKSVIIISMFSLFSLFSSSLYSWDTEKDIKETIQEFSKAGDERNLESLKELTSEYYRIVMNQMFGSKEIAIMDRSTYLGMIEEGKFGGDERVLVFHSISIIGNTAVADVTMKGKKMIVRSLFNLGKNADGKWILLADTPTILK